MALGVNNLMIFTCFSGKLLVYQCLKNQNDHKTWALLWSSLPCSVLDPSSYIVVKIYASFIKNTGADFGLVARNSSGSAMNASSYWYRDICPPIIAEAIYFKWPLRLDDELCFRHVALKAWNCKLHQNAMKVETCSIVETLFTPIYSQTSFKFEQA